MLPREKTEKAVYRLCEPVAESYGLELVQVQYRRENHGWVLRILVDRPGGVSVDECGSFSREISDLLDVEELIESSYNLEVSSPGLDRPLRTDADLRRARGRLLKAVLTDGRTVIGRLSDWSAKALSLEGPDGACSVARERVARATIEAEFK